jgi:hypothetical protein
MRTPRGRVATGHAYRHFGIKIPQHNLSSSIEADSSEDLFSSTSHETTQ